MPIYEYRCSECHQLFEEWCKHVEENTVPHSCPICKGTAHRIMSNTSFALKGGGWYVTEYGSRKNDSAQTSGASGGEAGKGEAAKSTAPVKDAAVAASSASGSSGTSSAPAKSAQ